MAAVPPTQSVRAAEGPRLTIRIPERAAADPSVRPTWRKIKRQTGRFARSACV